MTASLKARFRRPQIVLAPGVYDALTASLASDAGFEALYKASIVHAKPLTNALGEDFKTRLTPEKVADLFRLM